MTQKNYSSFTIAAWAIAFTVSIIFAVHMALVLGFFIDETVDNSSAAYHFFQTGVYSAVRFAKPFDVEITSGLPVTWISGIVWSAGGNLFTQRLLLVLWHLALFGWLLFEFFGLGGKTFFARAKELAIPFAAVWMLFLMLVPNWQTLLQNLAEVEGAVLFSVAYLRWKTAPRYAGFLLGTAVWCCKIIILPGAALFIGLLPAFDFIFRSRPVHEVAKSYLKLVAGFFAPLLLWIFYIFVRWDFETAIRWPNRLFYFVTHQGGAGLHGERLSFAERLTSPSLEWSYYGNGIRLKILILLFLPLAFGIVAMISGTARARLKTAASARLSLPFSDALIFWIFFSSFYGIWWFFFHPVMIYRHIQFALVVSFFLGCSYASRLLKDFHWKSFLMPVAGLFLCGYFCKLNIQLWLIETPRPYYSMQCRKYLLTKECLTEPYWSLLPVEQRQVSP